MFNEDTSRIKKQHKCYAQKMRFCLLACRRVPLILKHWNQTVAFQETLIKFDIFLMFSIVFLVYSPTKIKENKQTNIIYIYSTSIYIYV